MITQKRLQELLHYNPSSGDFVWLVSASNRVKVGDRSGCLSGRRYLVIRIDGKLCLAHRLAWLYVHGEFPPDQIDHINGIKHDNRLSNLRPATHSENMRNQRIPSNNTSGYKGVRWHKPTGKWQAYIKVDGIQKHLGLFTDIADAVAAYAAASKKYHGEFSRVA